MLSEVKGPQELLKPTYTVFLPKEGLQGEEIPSNITWQNMDVLSIKVKFSEPLKVKEVFNAGSYEIGKNEVTAKEIEVNGYFGLSFETSKVEEIETVLPVAYIIQPKKEETIEITKSIKLFRPQLRVRMKNDSYKITVNPKTGFIDGRLNMKNIGRGLLLIRVESGQGSHIKIQTPPEYREFAEKFNSDIEKEMTLLAEEFQQFKPFVSYILSCGGKDYLDFTDVEKEELKRNLVTFGTLLASDTALLRGFVEGFSRAILKNSQFQDVIRKVILVYESLVTKDILLLNPLDEIILEQENSSINLEILLTDNVYDYYKNLKLPTINIVAQPKTKVPIYKLFEWC